MVECLFKMDVFSIPVQDKFLLYAPLQGFLAFVNREAAKQVQRNLLDPQSSSQFVKTLRTSPGVTPTPNEGKLNPSFLGIIPTRNCNAQCRYCDFAAPGRNKAVMKLSLARDAINNYLLLQKDSGQSRAEVHFFGGEPFCAEEVVIFSVEYATLRAEQLGLNVRFEVTTNGVYRPALSRWIAEYMDTVVLSLDGPKDIQDAQRPVRNGKSGFDLVYNTAKILSRGAAELIVRVCVTQQTVNHMEEIACWIGREFSPSSVCFESMTPSKLSMQAKLEPPDPWKFAENFCRAAQHLEEYGIKAIHATTEIDSCRVSFCPLGRDAVILSPDGTIDACYLLPERWERLGLNLRLGQMEQGQLRLHPEAIRHVRGLNVQRRPLCTDCFCRYHCAGGCYVNHNTNASPGNFSALCIQTRLITITRLLKRLGQADLISRWLGKSSMMEASVWQKSDRLCDQDFVL